MYKATFEAKIMSEYQLTGQEVRIDKKSSQTNGGKRTQLGNKVSNPNKISMLFPFIIKTKC